MTASSADTAILHVAHEADWAAAQAVGTYAPPALARDGFLHACTPAQLPFVLGRHFPGATGLVLLVLDPAPAGIRVEWVRSEPDQDPFPHLHGPVPVSAVREARRLG